MQAFDEPVRETFCTLSLDVARHTEVMLAMIAVYLVYNGLSYLIGDWFQQALLSSDF